MSERYNMLWTPEDGGDPDDDYGLYDRIERMYDEEDDGLFHIGYLSYGPAATVVCRECGGKQFFVGRDTHYTAIKCVNCQWEVVVHEG